MNKKQIFTLLAILILASLAVFPSVTFAQEEVTPNRYVERLERLYGRLQEVSVRGEARLAKAHEVAGKVNDKRIELQEQGFDTAEVETALANFEAAITQAEAAKAAGDAILDAHAGFDDDGNVTDPTVASETLRAVEDEFRNGRQTLREAARNLRHAIRDFRRNHRG